MIYSNFPKAISTVLNRQSDYQNLHYKIILGDYTRRNNNIKIYSCSALTIQRGLNTDLNFDIANSVPILKGYEEDRYDREDPRWNIPDELFLMLTSMFEEKAPLCKYGVGIIETLYRADLKYHLTTYQRANITLGGAFWSIGIYKILTKKPLLIRIIPAGSQKTHAPHKYLLIHQGRVTEYIGYNEKLYNALKKHYIPSINDQKWTIL